VVARAKGNSNAKFRSRVHKRSDGTQHLGSSLEAPSYRAFPGPPPEEGPPLRILPIGGLGEIGMNCMLVGAKDRYILIDAGLMFPDQAEIGMQKVLPDTSFLAQWRDKIEAVVITHGHEDHIGALPWVIPALDPNTPVYAGSFVMALVKRRLVEYGLWNGDRFHTFKMRERFTLGPFDCEAVRVTHSIPDCCGLILRSEFGNIVHTGDWKMDEDPLDGDGFDKTAFEEIGKEGVALLMSDSTNVLSPGRTISEREVEKSIINRVTEFKGGRIVATQFASNIGRLVSMKKASDLAGRKMCFIGTSLNTYLEAAWRDGRAPFSPKDLVHWSELDDMDPNKVFIVTTGSQAEPRAALSLAAQNASHSLKLDPDDLVLYSAKVIPGNEKRVMKMMNSVASLGPEIAMGKGELLHVSGHAYRGELEELLKIVKPQHFLPVHGEYAFLVAHAELASDIGVKRTSVIRNGEMLGVYDINKTNYVSMGSMQVIGRASLVPFYNDGEFGTGTHNEMQLEQRNRLAIEGIVVAAVDVVRRPPAITETRGGVNRGDQVAAWTQARLQAKVRLTTRALWVDKGRLLERLHAAAVRAVEQQPLDCPLGAVERQVADAIRRTCKDFNKRSPEVIVIAHEADPRNANAVLTRMASLVEGASPEERGVRRAGQGRGGAVAGGGGRQSISPRPRQGRSPVRGRRSDFSSDENSERSSGDDRSEGAGEQLAGAVERDSGDKGATDGSPKRGRGRPKKLPPIKPVPPGMSLRKETPRDNPEDADDDVDLSFG